MRKILATLLTLALLLALPCALAETVPAINWSDVEGAAADIEGSWYTFDDVAIQFWIPDVFQNLDLTEEDGEELIAKFEVADGSAGIYAQYLKGYDGATMDETIPTLQANGATEIERCNLNGLDAVSFSVPDVDAVYVVFVTERGNYVQFIFTPASDEGFASVAQLVTASIMPESEE
jgi:hypothetical protein